MSIAGIFLVVEQHNFNATTFLMAYHFTIICQHYLLEIIIKMQLLWHVHSV